MKELCSGVQGGKFIRETMGIFWAKFLVAFLSELSILAS